MCVILYVCFPVTLWGGCLRFQSKNTQSSFVVGSVTLQSVCESVCTISQSLISRSHSCQITIKFNSLESHQGNRPLIKWAVYWKTKTKIAKLPSSECLVHNVEGLCKSFVSYLSTMLFIPADISYISDFLSLCISAYHSTAASDWQNNMKNIHAPQFGIAGIIICPKASTASYVQNGNYTGKWRNLNHLLT